MTPRDVLDKIKSQPIRERANENLVIDFGLDILYDIHQNILNRMVHCDEMMNNKEVEHLSFKYKYQKEAHSEVFSQISDMIERYEYYKKTGNYGEL